MCLGEVGFPKDGGGGFSIVFPLLVLFSLIAAQVVFSKAQGAQGKGIHCHQCFLLLLWRP